MTKKTFKENINPAMNFISQESIDKAEASPSAQEKAVTANHHRPAKAPEGYKFNPLYIETKSERLQLLVQPSLKAKLKDKAKRDGTSVNDLVHNILEEALAEE